MPGDGSLAGEVERFVRHHGLHSVIHRPGMIGPEELMQTFAAADLYVRCSLTDGSSISLLEAMAMRLPVLATDIPGNREWVTPMLNGWLVPALNADALSAAILQAVAPPAVARNQMGSEGRRLVES